MKKVPYLYRNHRPENPPEWKEGLPIRFKTIPKEYSWHDEVMGDIHTGPEVCDDIILIKKDGLPTYNFAHIIDDTLMECSHITRGVEYLSSTPNYLALYDALDFPRHIFVSLPHILAPTGNKKLGKRDGAKSVTEYRDDGILPEAMLNYLACLGWNDGTEQEIYSLEELIEKFSVHRIQNSGARFDEVKILWMNGQWIRKIATEQGIDELFARTGLYGYGRIVPFRGGTLSPRIAYDKRSHLSALCRKHKVTKFVFITRSRYCHIRDTAHISQVEYSLVSSSVCSYYSRAVEAESNVEVLQGYVVYDVVVSSLHKRRIYVTKRNQPVFCHPCRERNGVPLGDTDIEYTVGHSLLHYRHRAAR